MNGNWRDKSQSKKPSYWQNHNQMKRRKAHYLTAGLSGFICTCNNILYEKDCVRDSYNILNEFADKIFGPEQPLTETQVQNEEDDIDASLTTEVAALKEQSKTTTQRRFQVADTGAKCVVFIKSSVADPTKLAHSIVSEIVETKQQKSKFLLRLVPVEITCKANMDDITKSCDILFKKYFIEGDRTFSVIFNHRLNDTLKRDSVIEALAAQVTSVNSTNKVDLKTPDLAVIVEIIRNICCLAVVPDYFKFKKYNLLELSGANDQKNADVAISPKMEEAEIPESGIEEQLKKDENAGTE